MSPTVEMDTAITMPKTIMGATKLVAGLLTRLQRRRFAAGLDIWLAFTDALR